MKLAPQNALRSYVRDSSVRDSYWRCVTIHGTTGVTLSRNSGFNIQGSCYYLEVIMHARFPNVDVPAQDGVEERNRIEYNLAAHVHVIGRAAAGGSQGGEDFFQSDNLQNPADSTATGFYISNGRHHSLIFGICL